MNYTAFGQPRLPILHFLFYWKSAGPCEIFLAAAHLCPCPNTGSDSNSRNFWPLLYRLLDFLQLNLANCNSPDGPVPVVGRGAWPVTPRLQKRRRCDVPIPTFWFWDGSLRQKNIWGFQISTFDPTRREFANYSQTPIGNAALRHARKTDKRVQPVAQMDVVFIPGGDTGQFLHINFCAVTFQ